MPSKTAKKRLKKVMARSPVWLQTVQNGAPPRRDRISGTFGAASPVTHIDPQTGLPRIIVG